MELKLSKILVLFIQQKFWRFCYVPDTVLGTGNALMNKQTKPLFLELIYILVWTEKINNNNKKFLKSIV